MNYFKRLFIVLGLSMFVSCGAFFNQPFETTSARVGEFSKSTKPLLELPPVINKVPVAVYNFSDQTGQFKALENGSTFSTAVTQGSTSILIKALEDSGWFQPIERENFQNLSTERNIIQNTQKEYLKTNPNEPTLPPLLYAGLLLEGGIISYDTNIVTGGVGARYFGIGGSAQYRQDRITIYLRAVSTNNGEILKTIYVSKTILSQAIDASFFRFVRFQRLLEAETGITQNEPLQIAVKDAIEKAVHDLIIEGIQDGHWSARAGQKVNDSLVANYLESKEIDENSQLYNRLFVEKNHKHSLSFIGGINLIDGDFAERNPDFLFGVGYKRSFAKYFDFGIDAKTFRFNNGRSFGHIFGSIDLNGYLDLLPNDDLAPFVYAGPGVVFDIIGPGLGDFRIGDGFFKAQYGLGMRYTLNEKISFQAFAEHNVIFSDELDGFVGGRRDDFYFNFGVGVNYHFNVNRKKKKINDENEINEQ